ncbi:MAG: hypothetical protein EB131_04725, partial [Betaproteobacteria bacterium]|nr:hypothetical protein [Betaproteobacteria bacterium]
MKAALLGRSLLLAVVMGMTCTSGLATAGSLHPAVAAAVERAQSAAQRGRDAFIEAQRAERAALAAAKDGRLAAMKARAVRPEARAVLDDQADGRYDGQVRDRQRDGYGVLTLVTGHRYEGQFSRGDTQGSGVYYLSDGRQYQGQFVA